MVEMSFPDSTFTFFPLSLFSLPPSLLPPSLTPSLSLLPLYLSLSLFLPLSLSSPRPLSPSPLSLPPSLPLSLPPSLSPSPLPPPSPRSTQIKWTSSRLGCSCTSLSRCTFPTSTSPRSRPTSPTRAGPDRLSPRRWVGHMTSRGVAWVWSHDIT